MRRHLFIALFAIVTLAWCSSAAHAQIGHPGLSNPAVSPMIGLAGRNSPAVRYFSMVQPVMENRDMITRQAAAIAQLERRNKAGAVGSRPDDLALPQTGRVAVFNDTKHYFPRR